LALQLAATSAELAAVNHALVLIAQRIATVRNERGRELATARFDDWKQLVRERAKAVCALQGVSRRATAIVASVSGPGGQPNWPVLGHVLLGDGDNSRPYAPDPGRAFIDAATKAGFVTQAEISGWRQ
jgi:hypothetical protein